MNYNFYTMPVRKAWPIHEAPNINVFLLLGLLVLPNNWSASSRTRKLSGCALGNMLGECSRASNALMAVVPRELTILVTLAGAPS